MKNYKTILTLFLLGLLQNSFAQIVVTVAGQVEFAGHEDGPAFDATFNNPHGIAVDNDGNVYTADRWSHLIRKITPEGEVSTFAGKAKSVGTLMVIRLLHYSMNPGGFVWITKETYSLRIPGTIKLGK